MESKIKEMEHHHGVNISERRNVTLRFELCPPFFVKEFTMFTFVDNIITVTYMIIFNKKLTWIYYTPFYEYNTCACMYVCCRYNNTN